jgi:hypothetical protein
MLSFLEKKKLKRDLNIANSLNFRVADFTFS